MLRRAWTAVCLIGAATEILAICADPPATGRAVSSHNVPWPQRSGPCAPLPHCAERAAPSTRQAALMTSLPTRRGGYP